jgi:uncharacterized protein YjiS (DUF1127 family)
MAQLIQTGRSTVHTKSSPWRGALTGAGALAATWIQRCMARAAERRELAELSDWQLRDVGLTRADIATATRKRFWRV